MNHQSFLNLANLPVSKKVHPTQVIVALYFVKQLPCR
jgi:hypothetical protein